MAKLSEGLFQNIRGFGRQDPTQPARQFAQASPYRQVGTTDPLARRVGSLFGNLGVDTSYMQTAPERITAANEGLDMSTLEGQQQAIANEMQYVVDPQARRALGLRMMELNKLKQAQAEAAIKKQQEAKQELATGQLVLSLNEEFKDPITADLVRTGAITPQQGNARRVEYQKSAAASKAGLDGQLARLRGLGLKNNPLYKQVESGDYANVSDTAFAKIAQTALESEQEQQLRETLIKQERPDLIEQLDLGLITPSEIGNVLREPESTTSYSNKKRMLKDNKVVWVADVQAPNQDEFSGYLDPKTKTWIPVEAGDVKEIPSEAAKKVSDITSSDRANAAIYLSKNPDYEDLSPEDQLDLQFKFAFKVQDLIDKKEVDTAEEAYTKAFNEYSALIKGDWWSRNLKFDAKLTKPKSASKDATAYLNEATQGS